MDHQLHFFLDLFFQSLIFAFAILVLLVIFVFWNAAPYPQIKRSDKERRFYNPRTGQDLEFPDICEPWSVHLSVVVPAYNEEKRLPSMLDEALEFLENRKKNIIKFNYEIIVVSDGSTDKTAEVGYRYAEKYGEDLVRVLVLNPNRGKGGAVRMGVLSARGAVILFADADGATKFSEITKLETSLQSLVNQDYLIYPSQVVNEQAVVVGSRSHLEKESLATRSFFRSLLMQGFHFLVWSLAVRKIKDTQCGFKLFTRRGAESLFSALHVERWAFDVELLYLTEIYHIPTAEVCVDWTEIDGSKIIPIFSWIQMGADLLLIWLRYRVGAWKAKLNS